MLPAGGCAESDLCCLIWCGAAMYRSMMLLKLAISFLVCHRVIGRLFRTILFLHIIIIHFLSDQVMASA